MEAETRRGLRDFTWLWLGQVVSVFGSGLTGFALGVWVFQRTGSVTEFTMIALCASLPGVLASPLAGVLVDRYDRRRVIALSDSGAALGAVVLVALLAVDRLEVWHVYPIVALGGFSMSFQVPAYMASITTLVPKRHFGRANAMLEFGDSLARVFAPLLAGALIAVIRIEGIILLDLLTFGFAMTTLMLVRIPRPATAAGETAARASIWRQAAMGWTYIASRPGLAGLLTFFTLLNLLVALAIVLVTPLVLSFASSAELGLVVAVGSAGGLLGGILTSVWGGPRQRMQTILGLSPLLGVGLCTMGLGRSVPLIAAGYFLFFLLVPVINSSHMAIWQVKVEPGLQGRVFAARRMIFRGMAPLAYLIAGALSDHVFEPLLAPGGALAASVGAVIGVGPGRGIALLFITSGALLSMTAASAYLFPRLRFLEQEVPDALPDRLPTSS